MKTLIKSKQGFLSVKYYLDGLVFWREVSNGIEIKIAFANSHVSKILDKIS